MTRNIISDTIKRTAAAVLLFFTLAVGTAGARIIKFVYVSDTHYGLFRSFRSKTHVASAEVNEAMITAINGLPRMSFPDDGGAGSGERIGSIDFVANTGDIANRMEDGVQTAAESWRQFSAGWYGLLRLSDDSGHPTPLYLLPGNHDVSNTIGFVKPMKPKTDATAMAGIYNRMMSPAKRLTAATYSYDRDKVDYSFSIDSIHFVFVGMWPDSRTRRWIDSDLRRNATGLPTLLFTHDQPDVEAKHFINPHGRHDINATDKFENLLSDTSSVADRKAAPVKVRSELASFLLAHKEIKAYFHGNENFNEFYLWHSPDGRPVINTFRVDSPMKGEESRQDESRLSFIVACIDTDRMVMTVRELLWNAGPRWGQSSTISLR